MIREKKKIFALSGSTRKNAANHSLLTAIAHMTADDLEISIYGSIADLPHFDPDRNLENVPGIVRDFREQINKSDGVIICTPEYAHGVPGSLKNAIDWTVSSSDFYHKPTVLITASSDGRYGHQSLLETLRVIEAKDVEQLQLLIQFVKTKVDGSGGIIDEGTREDIKQLMGNFIRCLS
ncbi:MAG: NAD(P)H-dependent oxidoreductase [Chitinophagaceae bacterium]|nr:NAD(P)H-dependent oxidoreductase [Chitinophagaceae bacterium]